MITDVFTKFTAAIATKDQKAKTLARVLVKEWFLKYGLPSRIHSNQGRSFQNSIIESLCSMYDIKQSRTTPYHPMGNGQCEHCNRTLHNLLRTLPEGRKNKWPDYLPELCYAYNSTPHASTGFAPYELLFGRQPRLPVDNFLNLNKQQDLDEYVESHAMRLQQMRVMTEERMLKKARQRAKKHNRKVKDHNIAPATRV